MATDAQTSTNEALSRLVQCERHRNLFPSGMPLRACLRRQLGRQPGTKGTLGPPTHGYCASGECALGYTMAEAAKAHGIATAVCPTCGAVLFDGAACEVCTAAAQEKRGAPPATGFLPRGIEKSERIWSKDAPDAPIGPPPAGPTPGEERATAALKRVREAAPRVAPATVVQVNQEPARPAEETTMRARKCCGSKGPRHMAGCAEAGNVGTGKSALPPKLKAEKVSARKVVAAPVPIDLDSLGGWEPAQLRVLKARVDEVLRAKLAALEAETQAVRDALGEAA